MKWQLEKYTIDEVIKLTRRILKYQTFFNNEDIEIVQFSSGSDPLIYEQYFEKNEKYPSVIVAGMGGTFFNNSINDYTATLSQDLYNTSLGSKSNSYCEINSSNTLFIPIPNSLKSSGDILSGFSFNYSWTGSNVGNDDIQYSVYSNYPSSSVLLTTGSIIGTESLQSTKITTVFSSSIPLTSSDYCISMSSTSDSPYYIFTDSTFDSTYKVNNTSYSGSIVGELIYPPFIRFGGRFEGSIIVKSIYKNSSAVVRNLSELLALKFLLFKQLHYDRTSSEFVKTPLTSSGINPEWFDKDIIIKAIRNNPIEVHRRGSNDNIFTQSIIIDYITHWYIDLPMDYLSNIDVSILNFEIEIL